MADNKVAERLLNLMLGKETTIDGRGTNRKVQKKTIIKRGRKDSGPKNPRRGRTGMSEEQQLMAPVGGIPDNVAMMILQQMGMAGNTTVPTEPVVEIPVGRAEDDMPMDHGVDYQRAPIRGGGGMSDLPDGDPMLDTLVEDPAYQTAVQEFIDTYGREPATDSELEEIESRINSGDVSRQATEAEVLKNVTGTRGNRAANARGDSENMPPSDRMRQDSPMIHEDATFQEAARLFENYYGREPATDSDFEGPEGVLEIRDALLAFEQDAGGSDPYINEIQRKFGIQSYDYIDEVGNPQLFGDDARRIEMRSRRR